ncbi:cytochrome C biogenesis protein [Candidatus Peregrinibacteria bacterium CG10_big_fil_rev_8_21_14_0_10_49_24]|nr:MAG: cytochrome C biogenesis protein [Candidatus Peregrinibacteria bacterium CG11_big_fil_rev_8_21_14_0_20_49_14]PIR51658.1 MAG: cytochrome C biogenesis protein [Candidatus Peregrinibacteria bacterium CG10_big_fil_rev_8_21_14_0_10_49_24]PJA67982.1 MAG: cytochrome C biogenesis protein [Candidatus Peregrinibacteria bacterium CG_4_9_14_3_um_filter_49_12]
MTATSFFFAFLAGVITVSSPCVIPILPIILGSALKRNRLYPFFMILGLAFTFSLLGVVFGSLGSFVGLGKRTLETAAIIVLGIMGLVIVIKPLSAIFSQWTGKLLAFGTPTSGPSESPFQAFAVGSTLGIVWVPCAGPVLASVLAIAATSKSVTLSFFLLFTYAVGAGIPMLLIAYGGQKALSGRRFVQQYAETIKYVFGWILILTAILLYFGIFKKFEAFLLPYLPSYITTF